MVRPKLVEKPSPRHKARVPYVLDFVAEVIWRFWRTVIPVLWRHFALEAAMMGRQTDDQGHLFYDFRLDEAVPDDHPVRKIAAVLDLSWVYGELAPYYPTLGRPSVDPC